MTEAVTSGKRTYRGTSPAQRQAERRSKLLRAAIRLYGLNGYRNTSGRAVCREAGLTERYFYESFANSEVLLGAAYEEIIERLVHLLDATTADTACLPDPVARARALLETYYASLRSEPAAARVFLIEITGVSAEIDRRFEQSLLRLSGSMLAVLDPDGVGPLSIDPLRLRGMAGGLLHIALAWIGGDYARPLADVVEAALPLCLMARPA